MPLISVIVPCYNQAQYLDECLQSVLDQTFQDWECIIVNDGSPDNTEEVAKRWVEKNSRFKYLFQENKGVSAARNFGIEHAKGAWILPLDGDDFINTNYLKEAAKHFENRKVLLIYGNVRVFGLREVLNKSLDFEIANLARFNFINCSALYRKSDWARVNGYDINMVYGLEDWEFWINLLKGGGMAIKDDRLLLHFREKLYSRNKNMDFDKSLKMRIYIEKKHFDFITGFLGSKMLLFNENLLLKNRYEGKRYKIYDYIVNFISRLTVNL